MYLRCYSIFTQSMCDCVHAWDQRYYNDDSQSHYWWYHKYCIHVQWKSWCRFSFRIPPPQINYTYKVIYQNRIPWLLKCSHTVHTLPVLCNDYPSIHNTMNSFHFSEVLWHKWLRLWIWVHATQVAPVHNNNAIIFMRRDRVAVHMSVGVQGTVRMGGNAGAAVIAAMPLKLNATVRVAGNSVGAFLQTPSGETLDVVGAFFGMLDDFVPRIGTTRFNWIRFCVLSAC